MTLRVSVVAAVALVSAIGTSFGEQPTKGSYSFGPDQTIADIVNARSDDNLRSFEVFLVI